MTWHSKEALRSRSLTRNLMTGQSKEALHSRSLARNVMTWQSLARNIGQVARNAENPTTHILELRDLTSNSQKEGEKRKTMLFAITFSDSYHVFKYLVFQDHF